MPFFDWALYPTTIRLGAVSDIPSDQGCIVSLTADAAGDVVGASTAAVGSAGGHPGGTSRFDAPAPPQLVAVASAMAAIAKWRPRSPALMRQVSLPTRRSPARRSAARRQGSSGWAPRSRSEDEDRPRVRVWRGGAPPTAPYAGGAAARPPPP